MFGTVSYQNQLLSDPQMIPDQMMNIIGHSALVVTVERPRRMTCPTIIRGNNPKADF